MFNYVNRSARNFIDTICFEKLPDIQLNDKPPTNLPIYVCGLMFTKAGREGLLDSVVSTIMLLVGRYSELTSTYLGDSFRCILTPDCTVSVLYCIISPLQYFADIGLLKQQTHVFIQH